MALATRDDTVREGAGRDDEGRGEADRDDADLVGSTRDDADLDGATRDDTERVGARRPTSSNGTAVTLASKTAVDNQMKRVEKSILPRCYCKCCDRSVLTATFMRFSFASVGDLFAVVATRPVHVDSNCFEGPESVARASDVPSPTVHPAGFFFCFR